MNHKHERNPVDLTIQNSVDITQKTHLQSSTLLTRSILHYNKIWLAEHKKIFTAKYFVYPSTCLTLHSETQSYSLVLH